MPELAHAQQQLFHNPPLPHCSLFSVFLVFFRPFTYRLAPTLTFPWGQMTSFSSQDSCLSSLVLITHKHAPCWGARAEAAWLKTVRCIMNISLNASFCPTQTVAYTRRLWSIRHSSTYANLLWVLLHAFLYVASTCVYNGVSYVLGPFDVYASLFFLSRGVCVCVCVCMWVCVCVCKEEAFGVQIAADVTKTETTTSKSSQGRAVPYTPKTQRLLLGTL